MGSSGLGSLDAAGLDLHHGAILYARQLAMQVIYYGGCQTAADIASHVKRDTCVP